MAKINAKPAAARAAFHRAKDIVTILLEQSDERVYGEVKSLLEWSKLNTGDAWESLLL